jgi:arylsulfatase A-like enzyme
MVKILKRIIAGAAFVAATAFLWGSVEAFTNYRWPPRGTWQPDLWLPSTYDRVIFYAVVVGAAYLVVVGVRTLARSVPRRPAKAGRRWGGAVALAAVVASNAGWLVLGLIKGYELNLGLFKLDVQEAGPFFGYWGFFLLAGAAAAVGLAFALGKRRWVGKAGRYARAAGAALFLAVVVTHHAAQALRPRADGPNIVLIVLDAWRADTFGPELMPKIYGHAQENALIFERAWTCGTWTLPAMATVFTGQYPDIHETRLSPESDLYHPTVAQRLRDAGYETVALSANRILNRDNAITDGFEKFYFTDWLPFLREVHFYDTNWYGPAVRGLFHGPPSYKDSLVLTRMLRSYVARPHRRPYFLWAHYMDPHGPYKPPPGYYRPEDEKYMVDYRPWARERKDIYKRLYDDECRFMDDLLAPLLRRLAAQPRTITFVTADHGEEFWEHKQHTFGHGKSVYETLMHVPFFVYMPDKDAAAVKTPISFVALAPTILALTGHEPPSTMQGETFFKPDGSVIEKQKFIFMGSSFFKISKRKPERQNAVVLWPHKLILYHRRPSAPGEYYNLATDPGESRPLRKDRHAARLREAYTAWRAGLSDVYESPEYGGAAAPDLRALGYIK